MNIVVLTLAAIGSLVTGLLIYWLNRNAFAAISIPLLVVGLVSALLPWNLEPDKPVASRLAPQVEHESRTTTLAKLENVRPAEVPSDGYVSSDACRECHLENHETWYASYHRTMTQIATPEIVMGDFNDVRLSDQGSTYHLHRDRNLCWVDIPSPTAARNDFSERVSAPIVMTTGSHHMQAYWFASGKGRTIGLLPFVYLKESQEWIPRSAAFLQVGDAATYEIGRWSTVCSKCHSTHRRERYQQDVTWDTHVAELGISCEACHGPGQQHIDFHRETASNQTNGSESLTLINDPIVNPQHLAKEVSSQVCGQCHSVMKLKGDAAELNQHGHAFRPGRDLNETHTIMHRDAPEQRQILDANHDSDLQLNQTYYRDGMVRVSGREYNGLIASACYQQGEMTCLTCHQLHKSASDPRSLVEWANDQLRPLASGDKTCLECHSADQYAANHTHHEIESSGSRCYNCHMPHTTYGLLKAIRSHTISSPDVGKDLAAGRPNACNLCHLDKTLQWTADKLHDWYDIRHPKLDKDQQEVAASLLWILKGDAAERALVAWSMGWPVAQQTSGTAWQTPFLAQLIDDPYPAIRLIARRSLRTLDGLSNLQVDVFAPLESRRDAISSIAQHWFEAYSDLHLDRTEVLFGKDGIEVERVDRLMQQRDDTPVFLAE